MNKINLSKVIGIYALLFIATVIYTSLRLYSPGFWQTVIACLYGLLPNTAVLVVTVWLTNFLLKHFTGRIVFVLGAIIIFALLWTLVVFVIMPLVYYSYFANYIGLSSVAYFAFWAPIVWIIAVTYYAFKL